MLVVKPKGVYIALYIGCCFETPKQCNSVNSESSKQKRK